MGFGTIGWNQLPVRFSAEYGKITDRNAQPLNCLKPLSVLNYTFKYGPEIFLTGT
jgi:hypothetical protein